LHIWQIAIALAIGLLLFYLAGNDINSMRALTVCCAVAVSLVPFVNGGLATFLDWIRNPSPATRRKTAVAVGGAGAIYLMATAMLQERTLIPKMEDECSYIISTQLLAHGRLWMHAHPLADFFQALFVIVKPVYCSIYFPGTAIFFAPMVWLGWPTWIIPLIVSGGIIAMLYRIITELLDGVSGLLACFWVIALGQFRTFSVMIMSHLPMLLLGLLMIWAWLCWRRERRARWAIVLGIFSGWAAITRPADAVAYALPIGIAMLIDLWRQPTRLKVATAAALVVGAAPFLALQVMFDIGVTGRPLQTPYTYSLRQDQPGAEFGFHHYDPTRRPATTHSGKLAYYNWCKIYLEQHQFPRVILRWFFPDSDRGGIHNAYWLIIADNALPSRLLLVLIPAGLLVIGDRRRLVLVSTLLVFCLIYFFNPFFLEHYPMVVVPAVMLLAMLGARAVVGQRFARRLGVPVTVGILALSITSLWEFKRLSYRADDVAIQDGKDGMLEGSKIGVVNSQLPAAVAGSRAVVLFGPRTSSFFEEPAYNTDVANIDNAPIIRAHDLGPRDVEIIRYYAERQPDRVFYLCNAGGPIIDRLGTATELLAKLNRGESLPTLVPPMPPPITR